MIEIFNTIPAVAVFGMLLLIGAFATLIFAERKRRRQLNK